MEDVIHQAIKVEQQLKRKQIYKKSSCGSSTWKDKETFKKEGRSSFKSHEKSVSLGKNNSNLTPISSKANSIKCLGKGHIASQCPNKRTMVVLVMGISLLHLLLALLILLGRVKVNVMYNPWNVIFWWLGG